MKDLEQTSIDVILEQCMLQYHSRKIETRDSINISLKSFEDSWQRCETRFWEDHAINLDLMKIRPSVEAALEEGLKYLRCARYCRTRIYDQYSSNSSNKSNQ